MCACVHLRTCVCRSLLSHQALLSIILISPLKSPAVPARHEHTHTHIVFNCNGAFCESHSASCLFLHHSWNEGENISCQCVRKKMTIIDFLVYFSDLFISFCPHSTSLLSFPSFCILCFSHRWNKMHNKTWQKPIPLCYHRNTTWQRILLN